MNEQTAIHGERRASVYANQLRVGWNAFEFLLDFAQNREGEDEALCVAVVVASPAFAKAFHRVLGESIANYQDRFGVIPEVGGEPELSPPGCSSRGSRPRG